MHRALPKVWHIKVALCSLVAMKEHDFQEEVMKILQEVPSARRALLENHDNLLNVSEYCANNYMQVGAAAALAPLRPLYFLC